MTRDRFDESLLRELGPRVYGALGAEVRDPRGTARRRIKRANPVDQEDGSDDAMRVRPAEPLVL